VLHSQLLFDWKWKGVDDDILMLFIFMQHF